MTKKSLAPYLGQTLSVLSRTSGVAPTRLRAVGFLQQQLREGRPRGADGAKSGPRPAATARDAARDADRG
jgi:hypothetical protein